MAEREVRIAECELRARKQEGGQTVLTGRAIVYNRLSEDLGGFREMFAPGSLAASLEAHPVASFWQHDPAYVLGRTSNGTLQLRDGQDGLDFVITPPDTQWARDAMVSIERGDVYQMSFGWTPDPNGDEWKMLEGEVLRIVRSARLFEISPVTFPAYPQTSVELTKRAADLRAQSAGTQPDAGAEDLERALRAELRRRRITLAEVIR